MSAPQCKCILRDVHHYTSASPQKCTTLKVYHHRSASPQKCITTEVHHHRSASRSKCITAEGAPLPSNECCCLDKTPANNNETDIRLARQKRTINSQSAIRTPRVCPWIQDFVKGTTPLPKRGHHQPPPPRPKKNSQKHKDPLHIACATLHGSGFQHSPLFQLWTSPCVRSPRIRPSSAFCRCPQFPIDFPDFPRFPGG